MIRRIRAYAGIWALVALIAAVVVFVLAAAPRSRSGLEDTALRRMVAAAPHGVRDLAFRQDTPPLSQIGRLGATGTGFPDALATRLPPVLRDAVSARWGSVSTTLATVDGPGVSAEPDGFKPRVSLSHQPDLEREITVVTGRAPANVPPEPGEIDPRIRELEVVAATDLADPLGLRLGRAYRVVAASGVQVTVRVVGLFRAPDPRAAAWESVPTVLRPGWEPVDIYLRRTGTLLVDAAGALLLRGEAVLWETLTTARFRFDERLVHSGQVEQISAAVRRLRALPELSTQSVTVVTRLDDLMADFGHQRSAVRALLTVVGAGLVGTGAGLLFLAARLAVHRRGFELLLLRARGASLGRLVATVALEAVAVVLPAVATGWLAHRLVPGRGDPPWLAPGLAAAVAIAAVPVAVAVTQRDRRYGRRRDLVRARPGTRRLTTELTVLALAALGIVLVHRRGLASRGIDPYLSIVPVLAGVAAGLVALRTYPWPVRALGRLARRGRGSTVFLGLARAGRRSTAFALPLVVLVLAVALGAFAGSVRTGIADARATAVATEVGGDFRLSAASLPSSAAGSVTALPGVLAVAEVRRLPSRSLVIDGAEQQEQGITVVAVDPAAYRRVLEPHGLDDRVPAALSGPDVDDAVPALALPALAARMAGVPAALDGRPVRVVGTPARLPGLDHGGTGEVLVVPAAAAASEAPVGMLLVRGPQADRAGLLRAAAPEGGIAVELVSLADTRQTLTVSEFNDAVTLAFTVGLVGAVAAGLFAVGLALVIEARTRGEVLSLLRTMGLSARQARAILVVEVAPMMATALLSGAAVGVALPLLLAPALGLSAFTAGEPLRPAVDALTVAVLTGVFAVLLVGAVLTEAAANRRLGLGQVLRVGAG